MNKNQEIRWLLDELPDLVAKGVLDEGAAASLRAHYRPQISSTELSQKQRSTNWVFVITSLLGAILIGAGIILVFAVNWEGFSRFTRTVLSILPLFIATGLYSYTFFRKSDSMAWIESTSTFLMLMLASSIALISQTYNLGGSMEQFLFSWLILSIPLMYLMNASMPAILYMAILSWFTWLNLDSPAKTIWFVPLFIAVIPHLWRNIKPYTQSIRANMLSWAVGITLTVTLIPIIQVRSMLIIFIGYAVLAGLLYIIGKRLHPAHPSMRSRPFQTLGILGVYIMSLMLSYDEFYDVLKEVDKYGAKFQPWNVWVVIGLLIAMAALAVWVHTLVIERKTRITWFVSLFPVLVGGILWIGDDVLGMILANLFLLAFGIYYLREGIQNHKIGLVNAGMLFISSLIILRFFDRYIDFFIRGIIFILIGIGFLVANYRFMKKLKANEDE